MAAEMSSMSSSCSTSSETEFPNIEVNRQEHDFPLSLPFKFGPGIYQIIGMSSADALEHTELLDKDKLTSESLDVLILFVP
jgi:hypothetical protein